MISKLLHIKAKNFLDNGSFSLSLSCRTVRTVLLQYVHKYKCDKMRKIKSNSPLTVGSLHIKGMMCISLSFSLSLSFRFQAVWRLSSCVVSWCDGRRWCDGGGAVSLLAIFFSNEDFQKGIFDGGSQPCVWRIKTREERRRDMVGVGRDIRIKGSSSFLGSPPLLFMLAFFVVAVILQAYVRCSRREAISSCWWYDPPWLTNWHMLTWNYIGAQYNVTWACTAYLYLKFALKQVRRDKEEMCLFKSMIFFGP